jgi:hypothetical protein
MQPHLQHAAAGLHAQHQVRAHVLHLPDHRAGTAPLAPALDSRRYSGRTPIL